MREFDQSEPEIPGIAGSVLVAHPSLLDPNFRRSVVYITADDAEEGTHGIIINRPTGNTVGDLLPTADMGVLAGLPVFVGGPVGQDQLTFALFNRKGAGEIECKPHLEIEEARELAEMKPGSVRAFIGYSGWSKGQLKGELTQKSWIVRPADKEMLDLRKTREIWPAIMRGLGPWFRLLAEAPDDPSLN